MHTGILHPAPGAARLTPWILFVAVALLGCAARPAVVPSTQPEQRLLHGGCFVKDAASTTLGNVADADLPSWGKAVVRVQARYPDVTMVVPGHGSPGGAELLTHTATLLEARAD